MKVDKNLNKKDVIDKIELPENLDRLIEESVEKGYEIMKQRKVNKRALMVKRAAIVIGILAVGGVAVIPVKAYVNSLIQERMEQIPEKEIKEITQVIDEQSVVADTFSRAYTKMEQERMQDLRRAYGEGTFPENELLQEKTINKDITEKLYYAQDTATFYLPDRELTDEELLQIIDFNTKQDYALAQRNEAEISEEQKAEEQNNKEKIQTEGGITEAKAIELSKEWLTKLYGITGDGMELYHNLDSDSTVANGPAYNITFNIQSAHNCLFIIDAYSGDLLYTNEVLVSDDIDGASVSTAALEEKTDALYKSAKNALTEQLGKEVEYEKVILAYSEMNGSLGYLNQVSFFFVKADGSAYEIGMSAVRDRIMEYNERSDYEKYKKEMEDRLTSGDSESSAFAEPMGTMVYKEMQVN